MDTKKLDAVKRNVVTLLSEIGDNSFTPVDIALQILNGRRNFVSLPHQLPDEILRLVFELALDVHAFFSPTEKAGDTPLCSWNGEHQYYEKLGRLRAVCKRWDSLILASPPLWSLFLPHHPPGVVMVRLSRSGTHSLCLTLGPRVKELKRLLALAGTYFSRIVALRVVQWSRGHPTILSSVFADPRPAVYLMELFHLSGAEVIPADLAEKLPNLRVLGISSAYYTWVPYQLRQLTKLRHLTLAKVSDHSAAESLDKILLNNPELEELNLIGISQCPLIKLPHPLPLSKITILSSQGSLPIDILGLVEVGSCKLFEVELLPSDFEAGGALDMLRPHIEFALAGQHARVTLTRAYMPGIAGGSSVLILCGSARFEIHLPSEVDDGSLITSRVERVLRMFNNPSVATLVTTPEDLNLVLGTLPLSSTENVQSLVLKPNPGSRTLWHLEALARPTLLATSGEISYPLSALKCVRIEGGPLDTEDLSKILSPLPLSSVEGVVKLATPFKPGVMMQLVNITNLESLQVQAVLDQIEALGVEIEILCYV